MIKPKSKVKKKWVVYGHQGRKAGYRCIIKCNICNKEKEYTYSIIKKGGGLFCSTECRAVWIGESRKMNKHPNWKGGKRKDKRGYILIKQKSGNKGYIREHRLVMGKHLGRKLDKWEAIHHKNGIKDDNRLSNLEIVTLKTHRGIVKCPHCEETFFIQ